jgi:hypothetical protein
MAVVLSMRVPELTAERYDRMMVGLELDSNPPAGLIFHGASESVGAINIYECWQTEQAAESFVEKQLRDAVKAVGVRDPIAYRIDPLHNMYAADLDMITRIGSVSLPAGTRSPALAS